MNGNKNIDPLADAMNRIMDFKITMTDLNSEIKYVKESLGRNNLANKEEHIKIMTKLDRWIEMADERFAAKWSEKVLVWGGGIIGTCIIVAFMALLLKR